jgi:hypothetical protein
MAADQSRVQSRAARAGSACLALLVLGLSAGGLPASARTTPASACRLQTVWDGVGDAGDKRDFSVTLKIAGNEPGPYSARVKVTIHNPKVELCGGTISWYEGQGAGGQHRHSVSIGRHGGLSSQVTLPAGADGVAATVLARKVPSGGKRKSAIKPASGCTLESRYSTIGQTGDTKDFTVIFHAVSPVGPNEPATIKVEAKVLNPRVTLCSVTLLLTEYPAGTEKHILTNIGPHGGVSEPITIPANSVPAVKGLAKLG